MAGVMARGKHRGVEGQPGKLAMEERGRRARQFLVPGQPSAQNLVRCIGGDGRGVAHPMGSKTGEGSENLSPACDRFKSSLEKVKIFDIVLKDLPRQYP